MQDLNVIVYCREGSVDDAELKAYLQQFGEVIKVRIVFCKCTNMYKCVCVCVCVCVWGGGGGGKQYAPGPQCKGTLSSVEVIQIHIPL